MERRDSFDQVLNICHDQINYHFDQLRIIDEEVERLEYEINSVKFNPYKISSYLFFLSNSRAIKNNLEKIRSLISRSERSLERINTYENAIRNISKQKREEGY